MLIVVFFSISLTESDKAASVADPQPTISDVEPSSVAPAEIPPTAEADDTAAAEVDNSEITDTSEAGVVSTSKGEQS